jgi:hypothetical protein
MQNAFVNALIPKLRQGGLHRRKIRNVCHNCNGRWMSGIVNRAKPYAELMIRDSAATCGPREMRDLAAWLALCIVMAEFTDEKSAGVPASDRRLLWINEEPPPSWTICIGRCEWEKEEPVTYHHRGVNFLRRFPERPTAIARTEKHSFQVTTYSIGHLLIYGFSSTCDALAGAFRAGYVHPSMLTIWPIGSNIIKWPSTPRITDAVIDDISWRFARDYLGHVSKSLPKD